MTELKTKDKVVFAVTNWMVNNSSRAFALILANGLLLVALALAAVLK